MKVYDLMKFTKGMSLNEIEEAIEMYCLFNNKTREEVLSSLEGLNTVRESNPYGIIRKEDGNRRSPRIEVRDDGFFFSGDEEE